MPDEVRCELLVVGGGAGGHAALRSYREHAGRGPVLLVTDEDVLPYNRPPLSKDYLRGSTEAADLPLDPPAWYPDGSVHTDRRVTGLDVAARVATLADGGVVHYGQCVLATGAEPVSLPVPGGDDPRLYRLRSLDDARRLREAVTLVDSVLVLGSGFIGAEAAASLARRGRRVTLVSQEQAPQRDRLGGEAGERIAGWLRAEGVELILGAEVARIENGRTVHLASGRRHSAGLILTAAGVRPRGDLAGVATQDGRVPVDEHMRAEPAGLYAVGDVALAYNGAAHRRLPVEHWGEAERMGEVAGSVAAGGRAAWAQVPGFWTEIGDRTLKYVAWGDGYDTAHLVDHGPDRFTVWYGQDGVLVGALTCDRDEDYERAAKLIEQGATLATAL